MVEKCQAWRRKSSSDGVFPLKEFKTEAYFFPVTILALPRPTLFPAGLCPSRVSSDFPVPAFQGSFLTHRTSWYEDIRSPITPSSINSNSPGDTAQLLFVEGTNIFRIVEALSSDFRQLSAA